MRPQGFRWIYLPTRLAIYARDDFTCLACGLVQRWHKGRGRGGVDALPTSLSLDHVIPFGDNAPDNLVTLCLGCNDSKASRALVVWRPELADAVAIQTTTPIDRALGRELCRELDRGFLTRLERSRARYLRARRAAA